MLFKAFFLLIAKIIQLTKISRKTLNNEEIGQILFQFRLFQGCLYASNSLPGYDSELSSVLPTLCHPPSAAHPVVTILGKASSLPNFISPWVLNQLLLPGPGLMQITYRSSRVLWARLERILLLSLRPSFRYHQV